MPFLARVTVRPPYINQNLRFRIRTFNGHGCCEEQLLNRLVWPLHTHSVGVGADSLFVFGLVLNRAFDLSGEQSRGRCGSCLCLFVVFVPWRCPVFVFSGQSPSSGSDRDSRVLMEGYGFDIGGDSVIDRRPGDQRTDSAGIPPANPNTNLIDCY